MFTNISNFYNTKDYLPILNAVLITDILVIFLLSFGKINSKVLKKWYARFNLGAVIADVLIIVIGILITRFLYPFFFTKFYLIYFIGLAVLIQIIHDLLFYLFFQWFPLGKNQMIDTFKEYGKEVSFNAIFGDSCMMISSCLLASFLAGCSLNTNLIVLIISIYLVPYLVFM
jgi:hypothetical protein